MLQEFILESSIQTNSNLFWIFMEEVLKNWIEFTQTEIYFFLKRGTNTYFFYSMTFGVLLTPNFK